MRESYQEAPEVGGSRETGREPDFALAVRSTTGWCAAGIMLYYNIVRKPTGRD
jgi:hypothetical protein